MKLKIVLIASGILVVFAVLVGIRPGYQKIVHMKNETCPVSGHPVNEIDVYVHQGKKYNLCSDKCKQTLSENPKKYLSDRPSN